MYEYLTPQGWGDTFFQYVFDAQGAGLTDATTRMQLGIPVSDGQFLMRYWSGLGTIADGLQIYDWMGRKFSAGDFMRIGNAAFGTGQPQMTVLPEVVYPDNNGNIRFDLVDITQNTNTDNVLASQLVFTGARRRRGVVGDPVPSNYSYYEKVFDIPYTLSITGSTSGTAVGPTVQHTIPIQDFDFELRRVEMSLVEGDTGVSPFKILLYDNNWVQMANKPVLAYQFFHLNPTVKGGGEPIASAGELNWWPCPPVLYRVDSVIRFDIQSLLVAADVPATYHLLFRGIRRIPCN